MSSPLEMREFRFYLNFLNDDIGRLEISEPVKFDASEFVIEQEGYARDVSFMNEEISLEFYDVFTTPSTEPYALLNGTIVNHLSHCLDYLLHYNTRYGFESIVEFILERNGVEFVVGQLNFEGADTDELTYFFCKIVQNTKRALVKRREDTKIDGFSDKNLDGETITPLGTTNILLQAKSVVQNSEWIKTDLALYVNSRFATFHLQFQQPISNLTVNGIDASLSGSFSRYIQTFVGDAAFYNKLYDMGFVDANQDLTSNTLTLEDVQLSFYIAVGADFDSDWSNPDESISIEYFVLPIGLETYTISEIVASGSKVFYNPNTNTNPSRTEYAYISAGVENLSSFNFPNITGNADRYDVTIPKITITLPNIPNGARLCMYYDVGRNKCATNWLSGKHNISVISTAINSVIKGLRYVDLIKQTLLSINGMTLNAPRFDVGGEFYDLFAFSGNLIRQRDDVPLYLTYKDRKENVAVVNADLQINENDVFGLQYQDFYDNVDNGGFILATSDKFKMNYNPDYTVNLFEYKFKNYEKDRDAGNTLDAVHTESQWSPNNKQVTNTKKVEVNDIFDPFAIEEQRKQAVKETTALDGDDKIHVLDCIPLAPDTRGGFTSSLTHNVDDDGILQLLNNGSFSWGLLGFNVGAVLTITSNDNDGSYTVTTITDNIITLTPIVSGSADYNGASLTVVDFPLENVAWTNRTNEGFTVIENLLNPDNFSNLKYTIRRNMVHYEPNLSTYALYISDDIKNTEFKNNGLLVTQFGTGTEYTENGNIVLNDIKAPILTPKQYEQDVVVEYDEVLDLIQKYQVLETVGGFVRVQDTNGGIKKVYPKKLGYTWATKVLNIIGEERYEDETVTVEVVNGLITINQTGYDQSQINTIYFEASGEYVILFDINKVNLINNTKYDKFVVEGQTFINSIDLVQALTDL